MKPETKIRVLERENMRLREVVRVMGEQNDVCTYYDLKEICNDCRCKRRRGDVTGD